MKKYVIKDCIAINRHKNFFLNNSFYNRRISEALCDEGADCVFFVPVSKNFNRLSREVLDELYHDEDIEKDLREINNIESYINYKKEVDTKINFKFLHKIFRFIEEEKGKVKYEIAPEFIGKEIILNNNLENVIFNLYSEKAKLLEKFILPNLHNSVIMLASEYGSNYNNYLSELVVGENNTINIHLSPYGDMKLKSVKGKNIDMTVKKFVSSFLPVLLSPDLSFNALTLYGELRIDSLDKNSNDIHLTTEENLYISDSVIIDESYKHNVYLKGRLMHIQTIKAHGNLFLDCENLELKSMYKWDGSSIGEIKNLKSMIVSANDNATITIDKLSPKSDKVSIMKTGTKRICDIKIKSVDPSFKSIKFDKNSLIHIYYKDNLIKGDTLYV